VLLIKEVEEERIVPLLRILNDAFNRPKHPNDLTTIQQKKVRLDKLI
jgi:hypothetical protein